ncbi:hypothetical protein MMC14_008027 [Varicellaria rhodocarpa]|nr:hypothetical protein [Varicellaria rhodocarpa]
MPLEDWATLLWAVDFPSHNVSASAIDDPRLPPVSEEVDIVKVVEFWRTIKIALKTRDEEAKKRGQKIQLYEPVLEKVLQMRAELLNSHTQSRETKLLDENERELSEVIAKFVQGTKASTNEDVKPISLKSSLETKHRPGDIKIPPDEKGTKQIDDFIEYFTRNYATSSDLATGFSRSKNGNLMIRW